jgi:hypothetical protein
VEVVGELEALLAAFHVEVAGELEVLLAAFHVEVAGELEASLASDDSVPWGLDMNTLIGINSCNK